jgi:pimeloyl-ACP methyl ester carboxylesterase
MKALDLAFEVFGNDEKDPLIVLHGFFASSRNWRHIAKKLAECWCVYVPDARNHGLSPHDAVMNYEVMAYDIAQFIMQHNLTNVSLLGHSMGGKTAMWFALNYPQLLKNLIVVDIAPINYRHSFYPLIESLKNIPLAELTNRKQAECILAHLISDLSYRQFLLQNLILKNSGHYEWRIDLNIFQHNADHITAFPDATNTPPFNGRALFIAGQNSQYIPENSTTLLFPNSQLKIIADAEHWVHTQQPHAFINAVADFLL